MYADTNTVYSVLRGDKGAMHARDCSEWDCLGLSWGTARAQHAQ
jgi:hypothetical protein